MKGLHTLMLALPFRAKVRREQFGAMQFGLVGALLYEASLQHKTGVHTLTVKSSNDYSPATGLTVRPSPLRGSARPLQPKPLKKK
jgi:hypothetical protein